MFGGIGSYLASEVSGSVKRNLTIYGLYGLAALLIVCAFGYGLNALHSVLMVRYGPVAASLWIAGGLVFAAIAAIIGAVMVKNRKRPARSMASTAMVAAPVAFKLLGSRAASRLTWRMGLVGGIVVLGAILGRQLFKGNDEDEGED